MPKFKSVRSVGRVRWAQTDSDNSYWDSLPSERFFSWAPWPLTLTFKVHLTYMPKFKSVRHGCPQRIRYLRISVGSGMSKTGLKRLISVGSAEWYSIFGTTEPTKVVHLSKSAVFHMEFDLAIPRNIWACPPFVKLNEMWVHKLYSVQLGRWNLQKVHWNCQMRF